MQMNFSGKRKNNGYRKKTVEYVQRGTCNKTLDDPW